jgi:arylsulfatase
MYFDQGGNLNAIRWNDWKLSFAVQDGNIAMGSRKVTSWAGITNLRMDPYEKAAHEGGGYIDWYARQMWLLVPIQGVIKDFFTDFTEYPYQTGSSLNAAGINYGLLRQQDALKRLNDLEGMKPR